LGGGAGHGGSRAKVWWCEWVEDGDEARILGRMDQVGQEAMWGDTTGVGGFRGRQFCFKDTASPEGMDACGPGWAELMREVAERNRSVVGDGLEGKGWWAVVKDQASRPARQRERV
jgi:hypothetical protein